MSSMLEAYDMPMLEYPTDIDIQMHPSSSDHWIPDESHMEEDMKAENYSFPKPDDQLHMKTDVYTQEKSEVTIEVDMEPFTEHQNNEYEMQQDEPLLAEPATEAEDVEVYDVPLAQSPFMTPSLSDPQSIPSSFSVHFNHAESSHPISTSVTHSPKPFVAETYDLDITPLDTTSTSVDVQPGIHPDIHEVHNVHVDTHDDHNIATEVHDVEPEDNEAHIVQLEVHEAHGVLPENREIYHSLPHVAEQEEHTQSESPGLNIPENKALSQETFLEAPPRILEETLDDRKHISDSSESSNNPSDTGAERVEAPHLGSESDVRENETRNNGDRPDFDDHPSVNDPHEIYEGVYIDPPPPVLLSVTSEDRFDFSFFNEPPDWAPSHPSGAVFLQHLPTLYYEPLSAVFDALHEEEYLQSFFHLPESELVLDAVDLQLTISEDNVYAREVTLHDLNILHDISGTNGLLRLRLCASAPRFIIRYQHLQEQASRLNVDQPTLEPPVTDGHHEVENNHLEIQPKQTDANPHPEDQNADNVSKEAGHSSSIVNQVGEGEGASTDNNYIIHSSGEGPDLTSSQAPPEHDDDADHRNEDDNNEGETTTDDHDGGSFLPPLPADYEEENEEGETDERDEVPQPLEAEQANEFADETVRPEPVSSEPTRTGELELPEEGQEQGNGETLYEETEETETAEEREYNYSEETHATGQDDAHPDHSFATNLYTEGEDGESGGSELRTEEEEYVEDAVRPEELDTASHSAGDDVEYAEEEGDQSYPVETSAEDLENGHSTGPEFADDPSADLESEEGQEVVYEDPGVDPDSGINIHDVQNEFEISTDLDHPVHPEDGTESEVPNDWEPSIDHTGQEVYDWEENLEDENHDTQSDNQNEKLATNSSYSSATLSSKASKRSFDELEVDEFDHEGVHWSPPSSPDPKRSRIE